MGFETNRFNWLVCTLSLILSTGLTDFAAAQNRNDTIIPPTLQVNDVHSPRKATILAATIPGAGQAYNRKYCKIPIAYSGYAAGGYFLYSNQTSYKSSKRDYLALTDTLASTVSQSSRSAAELRSDIDSYRRLRDLSVLVLLAWHGLSIIDANVDAHFFNWDVSEDLSLKLRPKALLLNGKSPGIGFCFILNNK